MAVSTLFPVIFIDFNYEGKPGEKSLRSLDQVSYQDGVVNRARSTLRDSYGNPVEYDTLEAVDSDQPGKNHPDPNKFIIPGYASGILLPHEVPTRSNNFNNDPSGRKINDDRIHFIDPLQNAYPNTDKSSQPPSISLSPPGTNFGSANNQQTPINIPRPNIDLPETPQTPIDDPLNHVFTPPKDIALVGGQPSFSLEAPGGGDDQNPLTQGLIPPQIPSEGQSVFIPRPNIDIGETPIDSSNNPLNQGLLPPSDGSSNRNSDTIASPFSNQNQNGPVVITDVHFAPKPSNGLLPPKDPQPNEVNFPSFNTPTTETNANKFSGSFGGAPGVLGQPSINARNPTTGPAPTQPTFNTFSPATSSSPSNNNKFSGSFGGAPGVLGQPGVNAQNQPSPAPVTAAQPTFNNNKFSGTFGGSSGVLGGKPATNQQTPNQIPVVVQQFAPRPSQIPVTVQTFAPPPPRASTNKYQGNFGGSPGVLTSDNQSDRIAPQASSAIPSIAPTLASPTTQGSQGVNNRFPGFAGGQVVGGGQGAFVSRNPTTLQAPTTTQTLAQLPALNNRLPAAPKQDVAQKYTGQFGGAPGILKPYDNQ